MAKKFYVTAAIPYVNARPHMGHALEFVQADVIARYHRLLGEEVCYLSGSDENGLKIVRSAQAAGLAVQEFCDQNTAAFKRLIKALGVEIDVWQRGSDRKKHWPGVWELWQRCKNNGDIYKKKYRGLYCVGCEAFYKPEELKEGRCPEHPNKKLEVVEEENYFFRLSRYEKELKKLIESGQLKVVPEERKREALRFIEQGLEDFSISRSAKRAGGWGIPVPQDESQVIYVWYDALTIYLTGVGWGRDEREWKKWWPADLHVIGKGINRFHTVYWPAMLLSAGLKLPKKILIHGYVTVAGQKMSKSLGNYVDPLETIKRYGSKAVRYYLLREIPTTKDGDFTEEKLKEVYNAELANGVGNLVARVLALVERYCEGRVPKIKDDPQRLPLTAKIEVKNWRRYDKAMKELKLNAALGVIAEYVTAVDRYVDEKRPWELGKEGKQEELGRVLFDALKNIHQIGWMLTPFLPQAAAEIGRRLGVKALAGKRPLFKASWQPIQSGARIEKGSGLFPRLE